jgi:hypothetical protein
MTRIGVHASSEVTRLPVDFERGERAYPAVAFVFALVVAARARR